MARQLPEDFVREFLLPTLEKMTRQVAEVNAVARQLERDIVWLKVLIRERTREVSNG